MDGKAFGLLLLPMKIRIKIYSYCGLIRYCPIDLNIESIRQRWAADDMDTRRTPDSHHCQYSRIRSATGRFELEAHLPSGLECFCPSLPQQLLRVSRGMHLEAETVLYGMNQFKVSKHFGGDNLRVLRTLNPRVWSLLSSLHISLAEFPPFEWSFRLFHDYETFDIQHETGQQTLQKWIAVCNDLLSHAVPHQLKFSLSCNVKDIATAQAIVAPLDSLPPMSELSISLAGDPERKEIQEVARQVVSCSRQIEREGGTNTATSRLSSLSWSSLPKELRLDILGRTDLVDYFFLDQTYYLSTRRHGFEIYDGELQPRGRQCCYNCTPTLATCTCSAVHAGASNSCTCPRVPAAIISVSKDMSADATEIFFSRNLFIFSGDFAANTFFMQHRWEHNITAKSYIRMLDLEISLEQRWYMQDPNSSTANDWATLVANVASLLYLPKLWLSIDARGSLSDLVHLDDCDWRTTLPALFGPLYKHLSGQRRPEKFHVFLRWDTEEEGKVEKAIMGREYDSVAEGKLMPQERQPVYPRCHELDRHYSRFDWTYAPDRL